jgi:hypothetical protein
LLPEASIVLWISFIIIALQECGLPQSAQDLTPELVVDLTATCSIRTGFFLILSEHPKTFETLNSYLNVKEQASTLSLSLS